MAFVSETSELSPTKLSPDAMLRVPVGFVSPLWGVFSGMALAGMGWWWATQWMRQPMAEGILPGMTDAIEAAPAVPQPVADAVSASVLETVVEAELPPMALGGESAPIAPAAFVAEEEPAPVIEPTPEPVAPVQDLAPELEVVAAPVVETPPVAEAAPAEAVEPAPALEAAPVPAPAPKTPKPKAPAVPKSA